MMRRRAAVLVAASLILAVGLVAVGPLAVRAGAQVPPGTPLTAPAVALPGAALYGYGTPVVVTEKSVPVTFVNVDIVQHDFVQDVAADGFAGPKNQPWCKRFAKSKCPIFWSELVGVGQTAQVKGLSATKPGHTYSVYCTIHRGMTGMLVVAG